ncbi:hypothetical protein, partial [Pseudomonas syringae]
GRIMGMLAPEKNREQRIRLQLSVWNVGFMRRLRSHHISSTDELLTYQLSTRDTPNKREIFKILLTFYK